MSTEIEPIEPDVLKEAALRFLDTLEMHHPRSFVVSGSTQFFPNGAVEFGLVGPQPGRSPAELESSAVMHNCAELMLAMEGHGFLICLEGHEINRRFYSSIGSIRTEVLSDPSYDRLRKSIGSLQTSDNVIRGFPKTQMQDWRVTIQQHDNNQPKIDFASEGVLAWVGLNRVRRHLCDVVVRSQPSARSSTGNEIAEYLSLRSRPTFKQATSGW